MLILRGPVNGEEHGQVREYKKDTPLALYDLIQYLKQEDFFPEVPEESVWSIHYEGEEIGLYKLNGINSYRDGKIKSIDAEDGGEIEFKYYSNGEERAEYLFRLYCGNKKDMYFAWRIEEYRGYQIPKEMEQKWREVLIEEGIYQHFDEKENIEEGISLLKTITVRPGMYVGRHRLDLVQIFFDGWCWHQKSMWSLSYDLKQWLFLRESVVGSCSLNGWSVFYRTYGVADEAIIQFREFLETNEPTSVFEHGAWDTASEDVWLTGPSALPRTKPLPELKPYMDFDYNETITKEEAAFELLRQVKRVVGRECKRLKVFINMGRVVEQVRFFFDDGFGWTDGVSLNTTSNYYEKIIVLHGYIKLLIIGKPGAFITTIDWSEEGMQIRREDYQAPEGYFDDDSLQEYLISHQFVNWKLRELL